MYKRKPSGSWVKPGTKKGYWAGTRNSDGVWARPSVKPKAASALTRAQRAVAEAMRTIRAARNVRMKLKSS